jgi:hypothetical protein
MQSLRFLGLALVATGSTALATDLNVVVHSGGQSQLTAKPGAVVPYAVTLELGDASTDGLAGFTFDLAFDGGALGAAVAPASGPTMSFRSPQGFSNPNGFAGTLINGELIQVGGAQNTLLNAFAPQPIGAVTIGVAQPGSSVLVISGTVQVPTEAGTFTLSARDVLANGIVAGQTPSSFYKVEELTAAVTDLVITVPATLARDVANISLSSGGVQNLTLDAGSKYAGAVFWVLGSASGTLPGFQARNVLIPLNPDSYTNYTLTNINVGPLLPSLGVLDGQGKATASLALPAGASPGLVGLTAHHAYVLLTPNLEFASNSASVTLIP